MAVYYVTGVWKDEVGNITHLYLHNDLPPNHFAPGKKVTIQHVINLLNSRIVRNTVQVLTWDYNTGEGWDLGDYVKVVDTAHFGSYLRSHRNNVVNDNLDNIIDLRAYAPGFN